MTCITSASSKKPNNTGHNADDAGLAAFFRNDAGRQHATALVQTWQGFLKETYSRSKTCVRVESARGITIGHLPKEHAEAYAPVFKAVDQARRVGVCRAIAVGGTGRKPNIGV